MKFRLTLLAAFLTIYTLTFAQVKTPAASPTGSFTQKVGLVEVKVEYSRPSVKGRKIFGDLVPYGSVWRTGANGCTKITTDDDIIIGRDTLHKGTYSLFTIPEKDEWTIIFNKNTGLWGAYDYKQAEDVFRVKAKSSKLADKVESLTLEIGKINDKGAELVIKWDNTSVSVPFNVDTETRVMSSIKSTMDGPTADSYASAARYYLENGKDLNQAKEWIDKAIDKGGEKYWILRQKSLIQAGLNDYAGAIQTAQRSMLLAKEDGNVEYVGMNDASITEWKKKLK